MFRFDEEQAELVSIAGSEEGNGFIAVCYSTVFSLNHALHSAERDLEKGIRTNLYDQDCVSLRPQEILGTHSSARVLDTKKLPSKKVVYSDE